MTRMYRTLQAVNAKPRPRNAEQLFKNYAELFFDRTMPKGGVGRKRNMGDLRAFLNWAVWVNLGSKSDIAENLRLEKVRENLQLGSACNLPFNSKMFDLVISINTLHNLYCYELFSALKEIERVAKINKYICVESYRNEEEKANLLYWQVTCEAFNNPKEWEWWFNQSGYTGDYSYIYFS